MRHYLKRGAFLALLLGLLSSLPAVAQTVDVPPYRRDATPGDPPPVPGYEKSDKPEAGLEVEGRGPIHEGYAQPPSSLPRPNPVVPKKPPEPVQELPPDQKPEGDNVVWIPGYWAWDDDRKDFLWVSGTWRVAPTNRKWVPGYWTQTEDGWRWVSGFWANARQTEVPYYDEPPATLERGPSMPAPGDDYTYVPGNWVYQDRWMWQPGFWSAVQPGWVYTAPRWQWTPRGCIYVGGYWDYPFADRGLLFAPVYFSSPLYLNAGYCYRPGFVVNAGVALGSLWARPSWGCYAFGDYYGSGYASLGFSAFVNFGPRYRDPLYGYYRVANPRLHRGLVTAHNGRVSGTAARPPRSLAAQNRLAARGTAATASHQVVQPVRTFRSDSFRMTTVASAERVQREKAATVARQASATRRVAEGRPPASGERPGSLSLRSVTPIAPSGSRTAASSVVKPQAGSAGPRVLNTTRPSTPAVGSSAPRAVNSARPSAPPVTVRTPGQANRQGDVTPRVNRSTSVPGVTAPAQTPRVITPSSAPRSLPSTLPRSVPAPAPRQSAPPSYRYTPSAAPRYTPSVAPRYSPAPMYRSGGASVRSFGHAPAMGPRGGGHAGRPGHR